MLIGETREPSTGECPILDALEQEPASSNEGE